MTTKTGYFEPKSSRAELSNEVAALAVWRSLASPDSESRRPRATLSFDELPDIDALAREQGVSFGTGVEDLAGGFWPEDESVEDFLAARERWRLEGRGSDA